MQRTKSKLLSILLSLVMLLSLLPTTALAAGIPGPTAVFVDGGKSFYDGRLYYKKGDPDKGFTGNENDYIAHYDPDTGTLTLNGYSGGSIKVGGSINYTDITVVLKGTNTINGSLENAVGGNITITSSSGGTLSITNTISDSNNDAIGIETGLSSSYTTGSVKIKGDAKVTINMTHNGTKGYDNAYGIYAEENITISENASVDITCATPNNNTINGNNCNGLVANKNVTIDTNGTIKIDVTNAGGDDAYSYGIRPTNGATLTKVGEMEVKWKKHASISRYSGGTISGSESFSDTDHAINVDTTNCYASYRNGEPYTVTVVNGDLTGPGVPNEKGSGMFLVGDTVNITPYERKSNSGEVIPFKEWTAEGVTLTSSTTADTSFSVPANAVTVTATYKPFDGAPVFARTDDSRGTIAFQTAVKPDGGSEYFEYVKVGKENDTYGYRSIAPQPTTASTASPYEYSVSASNYYTGGDIKNLEAGDYRMAVTLNGERYLSEKFTVNYTESTADISLSQTSTMDFGEVEKGYTTAPAAKTVTITNSGTAATGELAIALEGANATSFELNKTSISDIAAGTSDTFTVQPKAGLSAGTYKATVKVSGTGLTAQSFDVQFTVKDVTIYLIGDVNKDGAVSVSDMQRLYAHLNGTKPLTDTSTADVNNDKVISVSDMQRLYAHLNGTKPLS